VLSRPSADSFAVGRRQNVNWAGNHANYDIMPLLLSFALPYKNSFSVTELGEWALGGVRRNPPPTYQAPMSLYNTPQRASSMPEQSQTQSTAMPGLGLALGPAFNIAVVAPVRSPSNP
jgi:hypothetical protein